MWTYCSSLLALAFGLGAVKVLSVSTCASADSFCAEESIADPWMENHQAAKSTQGGNLIQKNKRANGQFRNEAALKLDVESAQEHEEQEAQEEEEVSEDTLNSTRVSEPSYSMRQEVQCLGTAPSCGFDHSSDCRRRWGKVNYNNGGTQSYGGKSASCGGGCWSGWKLFCQRQIKSYSSSGCSWIGTAPACNAHYTDCFEAGKAYLSYSSENPPSVTCNSNPNYGAGCNTGTKVLCASPVFTAHAPDTDSNKMRIGFWNIFARPFVGPSRDGQYERQLQTPFKMNEWVNGKLDVICFDEAWSMYPKWWEFLTAVNFKHRCYDTTDGSDSGAPRGGVVIASKHPIELCEYKRYYTGNPLINFVGEGILGIKGVMCTGMDCMVSKGMLYARVKKGSKYYNVFATHMNANYNHSENEVWYGHYHEVRKRQADVAKEFMAKKLADGLVKPGEPMLFGGDLNTDYIHHKVESNEILNKMHIIPVLPGNPSDCTYCKKEQNDLVRIDYPALNRSEYIDYLGYHISGQAPTSKSIEIMDMDLPTALHTKSYLRVCTRSTYDHSLLYTYDNDPLTCVRSRRTRQLSDHAPVVATYEFAEVTPATLQHSNHLCGNRGGWGGNNVFSTNVGGNNLKACADYVKSVSGCGDWFNLGEDGWCDCVKSTDGNCSPYASNSYNTYKLEVTATLQHSDHLCGNRGGWGGNNVFSTNVGGNNLKACADYVKSVSGCGDWFNLGEDGWCDCVKSTDGNCSPYASNSYNTYKFEAIG